MIISKMLMLVILMGIGYVCAKLRVTGPEFNKRASAVVMNVFLTCTILNSVVNVKPTLPYGQILIFFLLATAAFLVMGVVAWFSPNLLGIKGPDRGVSRNAIFFMNSVFIGFPVLEIIYGSQSIFYASLTNIPFNLILYTVGVSQLRGERDFKLRNVITAPVVATLLSAVIFFAQIKIPSVIADTISTVSGGTIPLSMLIIGTSLGAIRLGSALRDWRVYAISFIKLIICPVVVWFVMKFFISDPMLLGVLVVIAACPVAMVLTVLCVQYGRDESLTSECIALSTIFSAVTIPFIIRLLL